jgi:hypothetical protein
MGTPFRDQGRPVLAASTETVQQHERLAGSMHFEVELHPVEDLSPSCHIFLQK